MRRVGVSGVATATPDRGRIHRAETVRENIWVSARDNLDHALDLRVLPAVEWRDAARAHRDRLDRLVGPYLERRAAGTTHPVVDFLFTYYGNKPAQLRRWHPGFGIALRDAGDTGVRGDTTSLCRSGCVHGRSGLPGQASGHDRVRFEAAHRDRAAPGAIVVLRTARVGHGLSRRRGAPPAGSAASGPRGHRRSGGVDVVAVHTFRRVPVLHPGGGGSRSRTAHPCGTGGTANSPVACTPTWICTSGDSNSPH